MSEAAIVSEAVLFTEANTLEDAVRQYSRLVYRISYSVLRNHHDAEDATQEVFIRVLRYQRDLHKVENPRTWLARIAWRVAVGRCHRSGVTNLESLEESMIEFSSSEAAADEVLLSNERYAAVATLIAALPPKLRDPLTLSTLEEMTPEDVAAVLRISEAAVRSLIFRARQILK